MEKQTFTTSAQEGPREGGSSEEEVVVHNTFLEVKPKKSKNKQLQRSHSDTDFHSVSERGSHASRSSTSSFEGSGYRQFPGKHLPLSNFTRDDDAFQVPHRAEDSSLSSHRSVESSSSHGIGSAPVYYQDPSTPDILGLGKPSIGSVAHDQGKCKPCFRITSNEGCIKGFGCEFCHLEHIRKTRRRPCKSKRDQCKRLVEMVGEGALSQYAADGHRPDVTQEPGGVSSGLAYLNNLLRGPQGKAQHIQHEAHDGGGQQQCTDSPSHGCKMRL